MARQQSWQQQVARAAKIFDLASADTDFCMDRDKLSLGFDDQWVGRTKDFNALHIVFRYRRKNCSISHHVVLSEAIAQLLPEKRLISFFVPNR